MTLQEIMDGVQVLSIQERKALISMIVETLIPSDELDIPSVELHSLLELEGVGKDLWAGIDAQAYVNSLRQEWDEP